jgi:hypothetical protein
MLKPRYLLKIIRKNKLIKIRFLFSKSVIQDIQVERETFLQSKTGLDQMYIELQKKLMEESIRNKVNQLTNKDSFFNLNIYLIKKYQEFR